MEKNNQQGIVRKNAIWSVLAFLVLCVVAFQLPVEAKLDSVEVVAYSIVSDVGTWDYVDYEFLPDSSCIEVEDTILCGTFSISSVRLGSMTDKRMNDLGRGLVLSDRNKKPFKSVVKNEVQFDTEILP